MGEARGEHIPIESVSPAGKGLVGNPKGRKTGIPRQGVRPLCKEIRRKAAFVQTAVFKR